MVNLIKSLVVLVLLSATPTLAAKTIVSSADDNGITTAKHAVGRKFVPPGYAVYTNVRFALRVAYPEALFTPQGESDNADGQRFVAKDNSAEITASGGHNALDETLQSRYKEELSQDGRKVTYKSVGKDWYVVSGIEKSGRIFYAKTLFKDGDFKNLLIEYDASQKAKWDALVPLVERSFISLSHG